ncbi:ribulose-phosphate 3-epimerase [bacterium]|nr:ribulose-phosphate 3-epimerase [bacterium]
MEIAPSVLAADLADLRTAMQLAGEAGCRMLHFDVMDGHFVPNLTFGPPVVRAARAHSSLEFDVHLMVTDPGHYIEPLSGLEIGLLSFQVESTHFAPRLLNLIRLRGMRPSLVLNPQTPLSSIEDIVHLADNVLLMSVDPGFAGQVFIERSWDRIRRLAELRRRLQENSGHSFSIQIDGGVNADNLERLRDSGVDIAVMGSAFYSASAAQREAMVSAARG